MRRTVGSGAAWMVVAGPWALVGAQAPPTPRPSLQNPSLQSLVDEMKSGLAAADGRDLFADRVQPYLGITTDPVSAGAGSGDETPDRGGLVIGHVSTRSPAAKAGLAVDDVVLEFDARPVTTSDELQQMVEAAGKGKRVKLSILRKGERREVEAVIGVEPARATQPFSPVTIREPGVWRPGETGVSIQRSVVNGVVSGTAVAKDTAGIVEIRTLGERRTVSIRGTDGADVHTGRLDADADFEKVPAAWRQKVRDLDTRARDVAKPKARRTAPPR
jgi:membrane-associated protease RseP (regulator of RpoE activity)